MSKIFIPTGIGLMVLAGILGGASMTAAYQVLFPIGVIALTFGIGHSLYGVFKRRHLVKKEKRQLKKMEKVAKKEQILTQQEKYVKTRNKNLKLAQDYIHTVDNYDTLYSNRGNKYIKLRNKLNDKSNERDFVGYQKVNRKLKNLTGIKNAEKIQPDYVMEIPMPNGSVMRSNRTYIQCFDERLAKTFANSCKTKYKSKEIYPYVCKMSLNRNGAFVPLAVSSPDLNVYFDGLKILCKKAYDMHKNAVKEGVKDIFPIDFKQLSIPSRNFDSEEEIRNENELVEFFANIKDTQARYNLVNTPVSEDEEPAMEE